MIRVTRRYAFCASHRLDVPSLGEAANRELFGKCNNPYGHGHNYEIDITVRGQVDPDTGRAVRTDLLDRLVEQEVLRVFDHKDLNSQVPEFQALVPTSENLGREVYRRLAAAWIDFFPAGGPRLEKVRIAETPRNIIAVSEPNETN